MCHCNRVWCGERFLCSRVRLTPGQLLTSGKQRYESLGNLSFFSFPYLLSSSLPVADSLPNRRRYSKAKYLRKTRWEWGKNKRKTWTHCSIAQHENPRLRLVTVSTMLVASTTPYVIMYHVTVCPSVYRAPRPSCILRFGSFNRFIRLISSIVLPIEMADHDQCVYMAKLAEQAERYDGL